MSEKEFYNTIESTAVAEFKDRGSKFIAHVFPIASPEEFKARLAEIKAAHPKATHHCFAYRLGVDGELFRVSDAGEPSGSAGRPILGQIDSRELSNVLVIVVRYFGGTLLGLPGLVNAYKMAASLGLQVTQVVQKQVEVSFRLDFDYTKMGEVMRLVKHLGGTVKSQDIQLFCHLQVAVSKNKAELFKSKISHMPGIEIRPA